MTALRMHELRKLPAEERDKRFRAMFEAAVSASVQTALADIDREITAYETTHGIDSATLRREVSEGRRRETLDVCRWLMLLRLRDEFAIR